MQKGIHLPTDYLNKIVESIVSSVPTTAIYVFGSYARGEESPGSDLDLYVVVPDDKESRFTRAGRIGNALLWMGMPKDIVVGSAKRFDERQHDMANIEYVVACEGVKMYG
ncbi:nucleotidyltransferase domain-containing protein [Rubneribacter sp.]|nr:nucleotidyltransferase domain-containing protein [Candidatus Rubneribacter avistercoris]